MNEPSDMPLWQPSAARLAGTHLTAFTRLAETRLNRRFPDYEALWRYSVDQPGAFWSLVWDYCGVIGVKGDVTLAHGDSMQAARFFPHARLNYAENLLRRRDDAPAVMFWGEDKVQRQWSWRALYDIVARLQQALRAEGVKPGDRVAGWLPNLPETLAAMLATASLGAVWTSCSPDFGTDGALDRFGQTEPSVLFCADGYWYNGKPFDYRDKLAQLADALPGLTRIVVVPYLGQANAVARALPGGVTLDDLIAPYPACDIAFEAVAFNHPLFILYSSGTTGKPKCIVHGVGGTLLQHMKEHQLHSDIHTLDRLFYFTTCGWMMWNWQMSALASGATLLLYDGSPLYGGGDILWRYAETAGATHFGTSAKFIDSTRKLGILPNERHRFTALRALFSTGSPLLPESFDWIYRAVKHDLNLASISGGTDIVSCFALGSANLPVYRGELQCRGLGMAVEVFDEHGNVLVGEKGELVCTRPFPSMPIGFWRDEDGSAMRRAYFNRFPNVWAHGDFAEITAHRGVIIHGRSDAVLNPGGVRIGTAELYRQVEAFDEIEEALAVGQPWDNDERVILFVRMARGAVLDEELTTRIKESIRRGASPRHVPAHIVAVADIPRTANGKIAELAVKNVLAGQPVKNLSALANPDSLRLYQDLAELKS
ncbi:MAG: acetoacetate--CoA ligase [Paludibacterium sp.]|uniref:acetoacetate--CoA ligase n=1 Tax=Paludibacterium sp. TaxID=1917523 RepID=UPI0025CCDCC9|nr:acetoacetate--CoA ligase [Paludibacterium sp.]MBV8047274.1 acetoacetate--CoA ligase [Paludibacterium sp.]MBV8647280.1 acetoacetate--CoA ligase [Paludibacterium sp.]